MITLNNISKSFDGSQILKGISMTFEAGKTNLIIGQSGSGKTVLLKCLLGLYQTDGGQMYFNDQNITKGDGHGFSRKCAI
jgi:phospholipid/cholesterol/gamma-HCH transport system ATP-binding protein